MHDTVTIVSQIWSLSIHDPGDPTSIPDHKVRTMHKIPMIFTLKKNSSTSPCD